MEEKYFKSAFIANCRLYEQFCGRYNCYEICRKASEKRFLLGKLKQRQPEPAEHPTLSPSNIFDVSRQLAEQIMEIPSF